MFVVLTPDILNTNTNIHRSLQHIKHLQRHQEIQKNQSENMEEFKGILELEKVRENKLCLVVAICNIFRNFNPKRTQFSFIFIHIMSKSLRITNFNRK